MTNEDMDEVIKIIKSVEDSGLLTDEISEAVEIESKQGKGGYLVSKFGSFNILTQKEVMRAGKGVVMAGKSVVRAGTVPNMNPVCQNFQLRSILK